MARAKRKRETKPARVTRLADPYLLQMPPCRFSDHHRKNSKTTGMLRNCEDNPNCLYGLGEHHEGVWQGSTLVRRVFGSDPRNRQRELNKHGDFLPCGLRNLGATCYLNSMVQCLFVNRPFRQAVYEWEPKEQPIDKEQTLQMRALQKLFAKMQLGNERYYDPTEFASTLSLNNGMQQDVQEFSKLLLAHLRTIFRQSRFPSQWDFVDRLFQGQMSYVTKCLNCQNRSMQLSSYYEISLNIKGHKSIEDCIGSYLSAEVLKGENKYFCEQCNAKQCAERYFELKLQALPPTLMVQLMRFVYDAKAGRKRKLTDVIEISETLNMTELLRQSGHAEATSGDIIYRLQGYLNHRGKSAHVGHYTATVAYPKSGKTSENEHGKNWFEFDDALVTKMTQGDATKERRNGKKIRSRDVYMLLYVRDDGAGTRRADRPTSTCDQVEPKPSEACRIDVDARKRAFDAEVIEYVSRVSAMEARMQNRLDAYKRYFENNQPYPDASADQFYWVDTTWLRQWVIGENKDIVAQTSSTLSYLEDNDLNAISQKTVLDDLNFSEAAQSSDQKDEDDECCIVEPPEVNSVAKEWRQGEEKDLTESECSGDNKLKRAQSDDSDVTFIRKAPVPIPSSSCFHNAPVAATMPDLNDKDIPFAKSIDVVPYCCTHSIYHGNGSFQPMLRFAPETASRLKRISVQLFTFLRETCGQEATVDELTRPFESMRAFEAPTYRCTVCETEFRTRLANDVNHFKEVSDELALLKVFPERPLAVRTADETYLMSRAWIRSYKAHLIRLHKELSHAASTSKRRSQSMTRHQIFATLNRRNDSVSDTLAVAMRGSELDVWRHPINEDITCVHGNLTLEKRLYRPVALETWWHFRAQFPSCAEFPEAATEPCFQCQVDKTTSMKWLQVAQATRDDILSVTSLATLYRRNATEHVIRLSDIFERPDAQNGSGLEKASAWTTRDAVAYPRRMFLVSRQWMRQWREYLSNVAKDAPPSLTLSSMLCCHNKLVLVPELVAVQQGQYVDPSLLEVEFVTLEEMQALTKRYGDPEEPIYYGLFKTTVPTAGEENCHVKWRQCSLASLQVETKDALSLEAACLDGVVPLECQDACDESVICSDCQASSDRRHRDQVENFTNCVLYIQQLNDNQVVPTSEHLTLDANPSGRRRSRRIRPGLACIWPVSANASDTVYMLKAKIDAEIDALPMRQRLYYKGEMLEDNRTLKHFGITAGSAVFMRLSDDNGDDFVMDEGQEREVGFANSVFLSHTAKDVMPIGARDTSNDRSLAIVNCHETCVWMCPACTFVNDDTDNVCEMCSTTKKLDMTK